MRSRCGDWSGAGWAFWSGMRKKNENGRHETGVADVVEVLIANTLALMVRQWPETSRQHISVVFPWRSPAASP